MGSTGYNWTFLHFMSSHVQEIIPVLVDILLHLDGNSHHVPNGL